MINVHTKFEVPTIICKEYMKENAKYKNSLRDFGVMHTVYLGLDGKRIVDFLVVIIKLFC